MTTIALGDGATCAIIIGIIGDMGTVTVIVTDFGHLLGLIGAVATEDYYIEMDLQEEVAPCLQCKFFLIQCS